MTPRGQARRIALLEERVAKLEGKMPTINTPLGGECDGVPCWPSVQEGGGMNEKLKAALGFAESEAFDHICYQYRATPMVPTAEVVKNFTAVKDAVTAAIAEAYRLGQERMRERCAELLMPKNDRADWTKFAYDCAAHSDKIRALPVEE